LFVDETLRTVVLRRLVADLAETGACPPDADVRLGLAFGRVASETDRKALTALFADRGWQLLDDNWLRKNLRGMAKRGYENEVSAIVAKLLLREDK
jgi:hypothetical protein